MADVLTPDQRRRCMSNIRGRDTGPEMTVRRLVHSMGFRYRLHYEKLPGKPDMVFTRLKKIIFVHGCFWHMHDCKYGKVKPATNPAFWEKKRGQTVGRDATTLEKLSALGWESLVVWECWTKDANKLKEKIHSFLG